MEKQMDYMTAHVYVRVVYLRGQLSAGYGGILLLSCSRLLYPASTCGESCSSFHLCLQVDWKTSSVSLKTHERKRGWERVRGTVWREGGKDRRKEKESLTVWKLDAYISLYKWHCETVKHFVHFLHILLISLPFPTPRPTLLLLWDVLLISQVHPPPYNSCVCCHRVVQILLQHAQHFLNAT